MPKYEPGHFKQSQYITDFKKENYDRIVFEVPKGGKEIIKDLAKQNNKSVSALITATLEKQYNIKLSKD